MGCDGGTIPTRGELVKTKKKPEQLSKETELSIKWQHCAISQEPLRQPIVACRLGQLYNKESLIEHLLTRSKSDSSDKVEHIKGLKDFKELRLTPNPAFKPDSDTKAGPGSTGDCGNIARFICPVTGLEMNGRFRFIYLLTCGCVFSERALQEVKGMGSEGTTSGGCLQCGEAFLRENIIPINGEAEEVERLRQEIEEERKSRASKKGKRTNGETSAASSGSTEDPVLKKLKHDQSEESSDRQSQVERARERKEERGKSLMKNGHSSGTRRDASNGMRSETETKKVKSIQDDSSATETFKSLFNTHPNALKQGKAHWVTYNPQYN